MYQSLAINTAAAITATTATVQGAAVLAVLSPSQLAGDWWIEIVLTPGVYDALHNKIIGAWIGNYVGTICGFQIYQVDATSIEVFAGNLNGVTPIDEIITAVLTVPMSLILQYLQADQSWHLYKDGMEVGVGITGDPPIPGTTGDFELYSSMDNSTSIARFAHVEVGIGIYV